MFPGQRELPKHSFGAKRSFKTSVGLCEEKLGHMYSHVASELRHGPLWFRIHGFRCVVQGMQNLSPPTPRAGTKVKTG